MFCGRLRLICRSVDRGISAASERLFRSPASSLVSSAGLLRVSSPSSGMLGVDQDFSAGLAAERAFDFHLLEKRLLLLEAAACVQTNAPSRCITTPVSGAAPPQAVEPASLTGLLLPALPAVPEKPLPATPAEGPLSSKSTVSVPTLRRLRRRLTPAQTARLSSGPSPPSQLH